MRTFQEIIEKYRYASDSSLYKVNELWTGLKEVDGKLYGDCEDFCIELKRLDEFKDWEYYYCKLDGQGHCVLVNGELIIDCNCLVKTRLDVYKGMYAVDGFKKYGRFAVISKLVVGRLLRLLCGR